jgi:hypothetical protein
LPTSQALASYLYSKLITLQLETHGQTLAVILAMRVWLLVAAVALVVMGSTVGFAQSIVVPREPGARVPGWHAQVADPAIDSKADPFRRLVERFRPLQRLAEDDRVRTAETLVGLGAAAFGASRRTHASLTVVGGQALRLGLRRQLATIRQQSGFTVEPSFGYRGFAITFRRTFE